MSYAAIAVAVVGAGTSIYASQKKKKDAEKAAKAAKKEAGTRPTYKAGPEIDDVYNLSSSEIDNPQLQDYVSRELEDNASNGIDAILKSGGKADFSTIHSQFGGGLRSAIAAIQKERAQKIATFNASAYNKAKSRDTEFQVNQLDPYKDKSQLASKLEDQAGAARGDADSAIIQGISNVGTTTLATGIGKKQYDDFGDGATLTKNETPVAPYDIAKVAQPPATLQGYTGNRPGAQPVGGDQGFYDDTGKLITGYNEFGEPIYANKF